MSTEDCFNIYDNDEEVVASFAEYHRAVACLPAMARILREPLHTYAHPVEVVCPLPRGVVSDKRDGFMTLEARP